MAYNLIPMANGSMGYSPYDPWLMAYNPYGLWPVAYTYGTWPMGYGTHMTHGL